MEAEPQHRASFSTSRRWAILLQVILACLAVLAIVVMSNYLGMRYFERFNLGGKGQGPLSPQTLGLLHSLTNHIEITVFFEKEEADLRGLLDGLLEEYAAASPRITIQHIAPISEPARMSVTLDKYKLEGQRLPSRNFIVVARNGGDAHVINEDELADRDVSVLTRARTDTNQGETEVPLKNFKGEMAISSAIFVVTKPRILQAYSLTGHGERGPADDAPTGYSKFATMLKEQLNIQSETLQLRLRKEVPADCQLLVIAGPDRAYEEDELKMIEAYLKRGGRALILLKSLPSRQSGLESVLEQWRIRVLDEIVSDPDFAKKGDVDTAALNPEHPITQPLFVADLPIRLSLPRPVWILAARDAAGGVTVEALATTSTNGYSRPVGNNGVPVQNDFLNRGRIPSWWQPNKVFRVCAATTRVSWWWATQRA